ncbi:MAG: heme ABC transporter ATP-binding protein, partial [Acidimicrobiales bacterium]
RDSGVAVLIVSSELDEVLALGDRIAVMFRGRIMAIVDPSVGREQMGLLMAGVADTSPAPASSAAAVGGSGQP